MNSTISLLIPAMVAARQDFNPQAEEFLRQPRGNPEARSGILAVGDHQIDLALRNDIRKAVADNLPPRGTDDVSDEKYAHAF